MQIGVETAKAVDQRRVFVVDEDEITRAALQFMLHDEIETHELADTHTGRVQHFEDRAIPLLAGRVADYRPEDRLDLTLVDGNSGSTGIEQHGLSHLCRHVLGSIRDS